MKLPVLETDRLFLLPWRLEYAKDMLLFASNENVINSAGGWKLITSENKAKIKIKNCPANAKTFQVWEIFQ